MSDASELETEYLRRAYEWLACNAPEFENRQETITKSPNLDPDARAELIHRARAWEARKAAAGYAGIALPADVGGQDRSRYEDLAFASAESEYELPYDVTAVTKGMVVPTIMQWGTDEQKCRFVPPAIDGSELWCQMFSEPGAGSDLAGLSCRATPVDGGWLISGQKVWTSYGADAEWGYLLARSRTDVPKHAGLTAFLLDMKSAGVEVRPLLQATGGSTFAEVFLADVFIAENRQLGEPNHGWQVALTTLMNERISIDAGTVPWKYLARLLTAGAKIDPRVREEAMRVYATRRVLELIKEDILDAIRRDDVLGAESSASKILAARAAEQAALIADRVLGPQGLIDGPWQEFHLGIPGIKIGGGTEDILLTVIGERVLGLPQEPRADRGLTWAELKQRGQLR